MRAIDRVLLVVAALALAGCPRFSNDGLTCGVNNACPSGFHCAADHRCWKMNQNPDLSAVVSGTPMDMAGADLTGAPSPDLYGVAPGADLSHPANVGPDMAPSLGLGQLCGGKSDCISGNCVDGVCCDMPCTAACMSCNQSTNLGKCTPVAPGNTPSHGTCGPDTMTSCGRNGKCDGSGNCQKWDSTTVCGASTCTGTTFTATAHCDGAGHCNTPSPTSCGYYTCDSTNGVCYTSCTGTNFTDGHCNSAMSSGCNTGSCGPRANGQPCSAAGDCQSNLCDSVSHVCCDSASCGGCKSCKFGTTLGMCTNVASGDPNNACATNASTCTAGGCTNGACTPSPNGTVCNQSCTMTDMFAVAKCSGTATSCPALGAATACAGNLICADPSSCKQSCSADGDCVNGFWCNGSNCAQQGGSGATCTPNGTTCTGASCDQCTGGAGCGLYYYDGDNDGYAGCQTGYFCGAPPARWHSSPTDCCDADTSANPAASGWFYAANGCGNYDYDCSGNTGGSGGTVNCAGQSAAEERQYPSTLGRCTSGGSCTCSAPLTCATSQGWATGDPGCGGTSAWITNCTKNGLCPCSCPDGVTKCGAGCTGGYSSMQVQQGCH